MKKIVLGIIFLFILSLSVSAQGFYFDIGAGFGLGTKMIGYDVKEQAEQILNSDYEKDRYSVSGGFPLVADVELRAGYGPFGNVPVYTVFEGSVATPSASTFFIGAGALFYPIRHLQLGASLGVSLLPNLSWEEEEKEGKVYTGYMYLHEEKELNGNPGFAWNISAAMDYDFNRNHRFLFGLKYSGANNQVEYVPTGKNIGTIQSHIFSIFVKYVYRKEVPQRTVASNVATGNQKSPQKNTPSQPPKQSRANTGIDGAITRASQNLINDLPENATLAVISISSNNRNVSTQAVDELEFQLVSSKKFTIVNRSALDTIRREQNFQTSGEVSDESAVSIGQMLGANIVITGSITDTGKNQRLIIRALDVRTAQIITMVREEF